MFAFSIGAIASHVTSELTSLIAQVFKRVYSLMILILSLQGDPGTLVPVSSLHRAMGMNDTETASHID